MHPQVIMLYPVPPRSLREERLKDIHLKHCHGNDRECLKHGIPKQSVLRRLHSRKATVLTRVEVLLCAPDVHQQTAQPVYAFLERRGLFRYLSWFGWRFTSRLVLDHDVEVNKLVSERAHVIFEAKGIFANGVGGEDIVPLSLALPVEENLVIGVLYFIVDIEGTTALDGKVKANFFLQLYRRQHRNIGARLAKAVS